MELNNISKFSDCYGCGVCSAICPKKIISMKEDIDGFYKPYIDEQDKCIECGLCLKVCSFNDTSTYSSASPDFYAGWSLNPNHRKACSSGGIVYEMGKFLMGKGYLACGVRYDNNNKRAEHYISHTLKEFDESIGSKYLQSYTEQAFRNIDLNHRYLIIGTPCQIDSIRRYISIRKKDDNFVLVDFFCHGVPSQHLWTKYLDSLSGYLKHPKYASWRNKKDGWQDSWAISLSNKTDNPFIQELNGHDNIDIEYFSKYTSGNKFFNFFLANVCLNKCCYESCKYKSCNSSADIRIGDLWSKKYSTNNNGVNGILTFTPIGKQIVEELNEQKIISLQKENRNVILDAQMKNNPKMPWVRSRILACLSSNKTLKWINNVWMIAFAISCLPKRVLNKVKRILTK